MKRLNELEALSHLVVSALTAEVLLTPKPGLVDQADKGSHKDMDLQTFMASIQALSPHLANYVSLGFEGVHKEDTALFHDLRQEGILAERDMFAATCGVNTHKGINFLMAVLLGCLGKYLAQREEPLVVGLWSSQDTRHMAQLAIPMTHHLDQTDWAALKNKPLDSLTHGEKLYLLHGIQGPRGLVMDGFSLLVDDILPSIRQEFPSGIQTSDQALWTLVTLMARVEDGNLIHRGGIEAWKQVQRESQNFLDQTPLDQLAHTLGDYNQVLIQRNLSPGGAADLLSLCFFFLGLEGLWEPESFITKLM